MAQDFRQRRSDDVEVDASLSRWLILSWLFAVLYILSTGPAAKLYQCGVLPEPVMAVYAPVDFVYQRCPPVARLLDWYVERVWHAK